MCKQYRPATTAAIHFEHPIQWKCLIEEGADAVPSDNGSSREGQLYI